MSAVTLETLLADFMKAYEASYTYTEQFPSERIRSLSQDEFDEFAIKINDLNQEAYTSWSWYQFARDHGLNSAMLYKLSDGLIDPRNGGEA